MSSAKLYEIKLAARVECKSDLDQTLQIFEKKLSEIEKREDKGYIASLQYKQSELGPGMFIPDFDIPELSLRIWVKIGLEETTLTKMSKLIKLLLDSMDEAPDTHVFRQSLNYQSEYDGARDEEIQYDEKTCLIENLSKHIECLN